MFKRSTRTFLIAVLVLVAGLFTTQATQAQGFSLSIGNAPVYGYGYPGFARAPVYNPYFAGYRGPVVNPYVGGYFPYHSYRANVSPYIRHYGYPGCW